MGNRQSREERERLERELYANIERGARRLNDLLQRIRNEIDEGQVDDEPAAEVNNEGGETARAEFIKQMASGSATGILGVLLRQDNKFSEDCRKSLWELLKGVFEMLVYALKATAKFLKVIFEAVMRVVEFIKDVACAVYEGLREIFKSWLVAISVIVGIFAVGAVFYYVESHIAKACWIGGIAIVVFAIWYIDSNCEKKQIRY
jgi:hypothetical protein